MATPLDFVIERSPTAVIVSTSVAVLFDWSGSVVPPGAVIVAVFVMAPVYDGDTVPLTV